MSAAKQLSLALSGGGRPDVANKNAMEIWAFLNNPAILDLMKSISWEGDFGGDWVYNLEVCIVFLFCFVCVYVRGPIASSDLWTVRSKGESESVCVCVRMRACAHAGVRVVCRCVWCVCVCGMCVCGVCVCVFVCLFVCREGDARAKVANHVVLVPFKSADEVLQEQHGSE